MKLKKIKPIETSDFWYDLFDGGYIKPEAVLADKDDVKRVKDAIKLLEQFQNDLEEAGLIEFI